MFDLSILSSVASVVSYLNPFLHKVFDVPPHPLPLIGQFDVLKRARKPNEGLDLVRIPLHPGTDGRR